MTKGVKAHKDTNKPKRILKVVQMKRTGNEKNVLRKKIKRYDDIRRMKQCNIYVVIFIKLI